MDSIKDSYILKSSERYICLKIFYNSFSCVLAFGRMATRARVYILIVLHKITMTPLIKGKTNVVTAEVLHFLYNLHFPRIFLILLVRCIDHNSLRITNLFSGHTICFCALPIYFLRFFFARLLHSTKSDLISDNCIGAICWQPPPVHCTCKRCRILKKTEWLENRTRKLLNKYTNCMLKMHPERKSHSVFVWWKIDSKSTIMTMNWTLWKIYFFPAYGQNKWLQTGFRWR